MRRSTPALAGTVLVLAVLSAAAHATPSFTAQWKALAASKPAAPTMVVQTAARSGPTAVIANVAGWAAQNLAPTNRSTSLAVSSDGTRVAIAWLHNAGSRDPAGAPTVYATVAKTADLTRFASPTVVAVQPFGGAGGKDAKYNSAHNQPVVVADAKGGFLCLSVPMNANGYAQGLPATGYAYVVTPLGAGTAQWGGPMLGKLRSVPLGSSLSEASGGVSDDGVVHLVGQGHLGQFQGGMGYQRWRPWADSWDSAVLAQPFRTSQGQVYFVEGAGAIGQGLSGKGAIHVAFAWNQRGATPIYGLYYLSSHDGGVSWQNIQREPVDTPVRFLKNDAPCAIIPAKLGVSGFAGASPGVHGISMALTPDGFPVILRAQYLPGDTNRAQVVATTYAGGRWVSANVGPPMFWNFGGTGVTVNGKTGNVNVFLLDPGNKTRGGQVLRFSESLANLRAGKTLWDRAVVGEAPNATNYASSLKVDFIPNQRAIFVFEPNYRNPGQVTPVLGSAPLR